MGYFGRSWGSYDFIFSHIFGCHGYIYSRLLKPRMTNVGVIVSYYIGFTHRLCQRPFIQVHVHRKVSKAFDMRIFYFIIYILFFQMTKRKNNPLRPKGKQKKGKILVTRYISHEKSRPSNDETKNNPPSTQTKKRNYYLTSFFDAVYFPSKSPKEKRENFIL